MVDFRNYMNEEELDSARWQSYLQSSPMLKDAVEVCKKINSRNFHAYIVGGAVRDIVLGVTPHDIDIATNCPMDTLQAIFGKTYDIGKSKDFGIVVVRYGSHNFEVAQFRQDGTYSDGRRPDSVKICQTFEHDAARRDFCMNAMAVDAQGNIIDYFDGRKDIKNKTIRTVGNPHDRFSEDYIRMMRIVRFSTRLGFEIHPDAHAAIKQKANKIQDIAPERIKDELMKMASQSGEKFANAIKVLDDVGILGLILPEITRLKDFQHNVEVHPEGNVYQHTLAALRANKVADPMTNLAILLHDVGKAVTYQNIAGKHTYHGHEDKATEIIEDIARKLKLSNDEKQALLFVAQNHMKFHKAYDMKTNKVLALMKSPHFAILKATAYADSAARQQLFSQSEWDKLMLKFQEVEKKWGAVAANKVSRLITGERVMALTGLKPGKKVGEIIKKVTEDILQLDITDDKAIDSLIMKYK